MSNISRRKFLKGAGVAALAVAAAGVLAGCSKDDIVDAVTKDVKVLFICNGATLPGEQKTVKVAQDATTVALSAIPSSYFPFGYKVTSTGDLPIRSIGGADVVMVEEIEVDVDAYFYEKAVDGTENDIKIATFACYASQKTISKEKAEELAGDWCTVVGEGPFTIDWNNNVVRIEAKKNERIQILANQTGRPLLADAPFCVTVSFWGAGCSAPARCPRPAPRRS